MKLFISSIVYVNFLCTWFEMYQISICDVKITLNLYLKRYFKLKLNEFFPIPYYMVLVFWRQIARKFFCFDFPRSCKFWHNISVVFITDLYGLELEEIWNDKMEKTSSCFHKNIFEISKNFIYCEGKSIEGTALCCVCSGGTYNTLSHITCDTYAHIFIMNHTFSDKNFTN